MKAIMVMFDSLNRHMLPPYGCDWVKAPNFQRAADRTVVFDNCYAGSLPCMPARREMHTGRYNFLHRSWGPIEPFDDSMPEILKDNGIYTHLVSDHYHYWEDGGCTFHNRYSSWEAVRGQEGDPWKGVVRDPEPPGTINRMQRQDWINRTYMKEEQDTCQARTFELGSEFIRTNYGEDNWFLQIETFDPHEPFFAPRIYQDLYPHEYDGPFFDWPDYRRVRETPEQVEHCRYQYAALVSMCDHFLGKVLDLMDELDLWQDTMLIINTDHGFLLGEHGWWAKCIQPFYNQVARIPLFIWDPRAGKKASRRTQLVQTIDLAPTLLEFFSCPIPRDMKGIPLKETITAGKTIRDSALFGMHGGHINCTDGRYVYMRAPENSEDCPAYNYTLMPTHMRRPFSVAELSEADLAAPFSFTKGCKTLKVRAREGAPGGEPVEKPATLLFDLRADPEQRNPIKDETVEKRMIQSVVRHMEENDAPPELFARMGLSLKSGLSGNRAKTERL